jgi:hypothetical protein
VENLTGVSGQRVGTIFKGEFPEDGKDAVSRNVCNKPPITLYEIPQERRSK